MTTEDEPEPRWNSDCDDEHEAQLNDKAFNDWMDKSTKPITTMETKETTFTQYDIDDYHAYEKVRKGGRWNMFEPRARQASGLSEERYRFVMKHFSKLKAAVENHQPPAVQ